MNSKQAILRADFVGICNVFRFSKKSINNPVRASSNSMKSFSKTNLMAALLWSLSGVDGLTEGKNANIMHCNKTNTAKPAILSDQERGLLIGVLFI
jgi:hypothetical protein